MDSKTGPVRIPEPEDVILSPRERTMKARMLVVLEALEAGHSRQSAASLADIAASTIASWIQQGRYKLTHALYPWFYHEVQRSEGIGEAQFANIVISEAVDKHNWRAAMFVLQKRYKWSERPEMDNDLQRDQQKAQLSKTKADTVFVEARTKKLEEDGEEIVLERLRDILNEVREEVKADGKERPVN
jgi:transposase